MATARPKGGQDSPRAAIVDACDDPFIHRGASGNHGPVACAAVLRGFGRRDPEEIQGRIVEPFFTPRRLGEGSGLGLSICRDIVSRDHGTLTFTTRPGSTTFTVTLPRRGTTPPQPRTRRSPG